MVEEKDFDAWINSNIRSLWFLWGIMDDGDYMVDSWRGKWWKIRINAVSMVASNFRMDARDNTHCKFT
jgi:hypothetical protein